MNKNTQPSTVKFDDKDKDFFDFEIRAKSLKQITNEVSNLKRKKSDASSSNRLPKNFFKKKNNVST